MLHERAGVGIERAGDTPARRWAMRNTPKPEAASSTTAASTPGDAAPERVTRSVTLMLGLVCAGAADFRRPLGPSARP